MEENSLMPKKKWNLNALAFLEIGAFEIGFVAVVLLLLFGILNYFNILSISAVFPNQLGWLPRQQVKIALQGDALQKNVTSPPSNFTPSAFQYDVEKAKNLGSKSIE